MHSGFNTKTTTTNQNFIHTQIKTPENKPVEKKVAILNQYFLCLSWLPSWLRAIKIFTNKDPRGILLLKVISGGERKYSTVKTQWVLGIPV